MLSQTHIIRGEGEDILFFPATFSLYRLPPGLRSPLSVSDLGPGGAALLAAEAERHERLRPAPPLPAAPTSLCLYVAQDCNLACSYCYNDGGRAAGSVQRMSPAVAEAALRRFFTEPGEHYAVSFYGGEPLLNRAVVERTVAFGERLAAERGFRIAFHMTTNGTLVDARALALLARFATVTVSLDGPPAVHDRHRRSRRGTGSHRRAVAALRALRTLKGPRVTVKGTLTVAGAGRYGETAAYLNALGADAVGLTPVFAPPGHPARLSDAAHERYVADYLAIHCDPERALEAPLQHGEALGLMGRILRRQRVHRHCHAGRDLAVAADGSLYACHGLAGVGAFRMGHVEEAAPSAEFGGVAARFAVLGVDAAEPCRGCFARYLCGGGCYAHGQFLHGDPAQPDPRHCDLERRRLEHVLRGLAAILRDPGRRTRLKSLIAGEG